MAKKHQTSKGMLTCREIYNAHEYKDHISVNLVRSRVGSRGGMCPSWWWDKMPPAAFRKKLIAAGLDSQKDSGNCSRSVEKVNFDKSIVCFRNKHTEKCDHYWDLTETFGTDKPIPATCDHVKNGDCPMYKWSDPVLAVQL